MPLDALILTLLFPRPLDLFPPSAVGFTGMPASIPVAITQTYNSYPAVSSVIYTHNHETSGL